VHSRPLTCEVQLRERDFPAYSPTAQALSRNASRTHSRGPPVIIGQGLELDMHSKRIRACSASHFEGCCLPDLPMCGYPESVSDRLTLWSKPMSCGAGA
jgi:hypothetical protein